MNAPQFTPGPWEFERGADSKPRPWIGRLEDHAYSALACGETYEESMANARLIAAAPELYEALDLLCGLERSIKIDIGLLHKNRLRQSTSSDLQIGTDADFRTELETAFGKVRAALAKARGEQ